MCFNLKMVPFNKFVIKKPRYKLMHQDEQNKPIQVHKLKIRVLIKNNCNKCTE